MSENPSISPEKLNLNEMEEWGKMKSKFRPFDQLLHHNSVKKQ